ncbi:MAG: photosynthetic reaction center cytochrome c subunit family protein [Bryobacteraceae bacterium]
MNASKMLGALVCLLSIAPARGQAGPGQKPVMAEDVFKNVQVLRGIPVNEFMETMGFFSASLSLNCTDCHVAQSLGSWAKYAEDIPLKRTARRMIVMVNAINKANFGGQRMVTCYSCHRGAQHPKVIPSLAEQYSAPPPDDPNEVEILAQPSEGPGVDQILDKYIQAVGGTERLANLTSFVAKGTYRGYDTGLSKVPVDVYAKAPGQRTTIVHTLIGDSTTTYDGRTGWLAANDKPLPVLALPPGEDSDGLKLDAELSFPAQIKQTLSQWRAGFPATMIDDRLVLVVQGITSGRSRVKLFFDKESGLLVRQVRYVDTPVGIVPAQVDYADYRDVSGVKMPYRLTLTWTDGRSTIELSEVQPNVPIDASKFAKPAPPASPPKPATP